MQSEQLWYVGASGLPDLARVPGAPPVRQYRGEDTARQADSDSRYRSFGGTALRATAAPRRRRLQSSDGPSRGQIVDMRARRVRQVGGDQLPAGRDMLPADYRRLAQAARDQFVREPVAGGFTRKPNRVDGVLRNFPADPDGAEDMPITVVRSRIKVQDYVGIDSARLPAAADTGNYAEPQLNSDSRYDPMPVSVAVADEPRSQSEAHVSGTQSGTLAQTATDPQRRTLTAVQQRRNRVSSPLPTELRVVVEPDTSSEEPALPPQSEGVVPQAQYPPANPDSPLLQLQLAYTAAIPTAAFHRPAAPLPPVFRWNSPRTDDGWPLPEFSREAQPTTDWARQAYDQGTSDAAFERPLIWKIRPRDREQYRRLFARLNDIDSIGPRQTAMANALYQLERARITTELARILRDSFSFRERIENWFVQNRLWNVASNIDMGIHKIAQKIASKRTTAAQATPKTSSSTKPKPHAPQPGQSALQSAGANGVMVSASGKRVIPLQPVAPTTWATPYYKPRVVPQRSKATRVLPREDEPRPEELRTAPSTQPLTPSNSATPAFDALADRHDVNLLDAVLGAVAVASLRAAGQAGIKAMNTAQHGYTKA